MPSWPCLLRRPIINYLIPHRHQPPRCFMQTIVHIVGQPSPEGPPTVVLNHGNQRYMFNCREGTQRLCVEDKIRLSKLSHVFLTRLEWPCVGGLPGMLLTLADAGIKNVCVHGSKNVTHFMVSLRYFVYRTSTSVDTREYTANDAPVFDDGALRVQPVVILPELTDTEPNEQRSVSAGSKRRRLHDDSDSSSDDASPTQSEYRKAIETLDAMADDKQMAHRRELLSRMFRGNSAMEAPTANTTTTTTATTTTAIEAHVDLERVDADGKAKAKTIVQDAHPLSRPHRQGSLVNTPMPRTKPYPSVISYICEGASLKGKFNKAAAQALGVPVGPLFGELQRGQTITLADGTVVRPDQVMAPDIPGPIFMVIDCPDRRYLPGLISSPTFEPYQQHTRQPHLIVHLISDEVLNDVRYRQWMGRFGSETQHVVGTETISAQTVLFKSHALAQYKLSQLNAGLFPIPSYSNTPQRTLDECKYSQFGWWTYHGLDSDLPDQCQALQHLDTFHLHPKKPMERPWVPFEPAKEEEVRMVQNDPQIQQVILAARDAAAATPVDVFPGDDIDIITLGTGSSIPSKYRNVSATLVKVPGFGSILLDAGEGTYGQMQRRFGDAVHSEMAALRCIFVSHMHADHHLGVIHMLNKWTELHADTEQSLFILAPFLFRRWLNEYRQVAPVGRRGQIRLIRNESLTVKASRIFHHEQNALEALCKSFGLSVVRAVEVVHCAFSYGLALEHKSGWKMVYSGDTRPCEALIEAGQGATLLIHEATLDDTMMEEALKKRHSTMGEAVAVGQRMQARYTLLNHFSQRYPKFPTLGEGQENTCVSFDMMSVTLRDLPRLPELTPALQLLYAEEPVDEKETV